MLRSVTPPPSCPLLPEKCSFKSLKINAQHPSISVSFSTIPNLHSSLLYNTNFTLFPSILYQFYTPPFSTTPILLSSLLNNTCFTLLSSRQHQFYTPPFSTTPIFHSFLLDNTNFTPSIHDNTHFSLSLHENTNFTPLPSPQYQFYTPPFMTIPILHSSLHDNTNFTPLPTRQYLFTPKE